MRRYALDSGKLLQIWAISESFYMKFLAQVAMLAHQSTKVFTNLQKYVAIYRLHATVFNANFNLEP